MQDKVVVVIKRIRKLCCMLILLFMLSAGCIGSLSVHASVDFTVSPASAVLETQGNYGVYFEPDTASARVTMVTGGLPVSVTGITSNGWFQVDIGGTYYMQGAALGNPGSYVAVTQTPAIPTAQPGIPETTQLPDSESSITLPSTELVIPTPAPISYMPAVRRSSMEYSIANTGEIPDIMKEATNLHADKVYINSKVSAYNALWAAQTDFIKNKGIYTYEEATIRTCGISSVGRRYALTFGHVSTIQEEEYVDRQTVDLAYAANVGSDYDKIKKVHDYICEHVEYSYETAQNKAGYDYRSAYDALASKKAVCTGYALLFQKFMDIYKIPCYVATGNNHAWNIVQLDGKWYYLDCTNDDQKGSVSYRYFLIGGKKAGYTSIGGIRLSDTDYVPE